jgi:hypothetical protein
VLGQHLRDRRRQRRLAMIDVTDRPNVYVRLAAIKFFLRHDCSLILFCLSFPQGICFTLFGLSFP